MELSTSNQARRDPSVRAALKKQQRARLAVKAKVAAGEIEPEEYSAMFAAQPEQIARKAIQDAERAQRKAAREQRYAEALQRAEGGASVFEGDAA